MLSSKQVGSSSWPSTRTISSPEVHNSHFRKSFIIWTGRAFESIILAEITTTFSLHVTTNMHGVESTRTMAPVVTEAPTASTASAYCLLATLAKSIFTLSNSILAGFHLLMYVLAYVCSRYRCGTTVHRSAGTNMRSEVLIPSWCGHVFERTHCLDHNGTIVQGRLRLLYCSSDRATDGSIWA